MSNDVFVRSLISDLADKGYGEQINDNTIVSLTEDRTEVALEPIYKDDELTGEVVGIIALTNGVETLEINYDEKDFEQRVLASVLSDLQVL